MVSEEAQPNFVDDEDDDIKKTLGHLDDNYNPFKDQIDNLEPSANPNDQLFEQVQFDVDPFGADAAENFDDPEFIKKQLEEYEKYQKMHKN